MATHQSAKKRIRSSEKRRVRNQAARSELNTLIKKVYSLEDKEKAEAAYKEAVSFIDKTVGKGRLHKNTAARKKSAITKYVNKLNAEK
ncbi:MAG: 30S ribosomal protein S20 [Melioribacteraceae bacterium]|nr:30S ribosomal protein S20 [Melioribacteraceae bacterium]MCO6472874.1 30S ribosomal protein S20 [Melioribacteraceae bacterium]